MIRPLYLGAIVIPSPAPTDFDAWYANPYTKVLLKSIEDDYVPRAASGASPEPTAERKCLTPGAIYSIDTKTWSPCIDFSVTLLSQHQKLLVTEALSKALEQAFHDAIEPILATIWTTSWKSL